MREKAPPRAGGWRGAGSSPAAPHEVLFEFVRLGPQVRVSAIDAASGREVVIVAPATASEARMKAIALAKLQRRLGQA